METLILANNNFDGKQTEKRICCGEFEKHSQNPDSITQKNFHIKTVWTKEMKEKNTEYLPIFFFASLVVSDWFSIESKIVFYLDFPQSALRWLLYTWQIY